jgi:hypothetical protein
VEDGLMADPKVHVVVPCRPDHARQIDFFVRLMMLQLPPGSWIQFYPGFFAHRNRTHGTEAALQGGATHVFFVDDDQLLQPDTVTRLLAHDTDIVSVNLLYKERPHEAYMFERLKGGLFPTPLGTQRGLVEVDACGLGGVLVKADVFRRITEYEWFAVNEKAKTDDLYFCELAQQHGFRVLVDLEAIAGHITYGAVWPAWTGERWETLVQIAGGGEFFAPAPDRTPEFAAWRKTYLDAVARDETEEAAARAADAAATQAGAALVQS